MKKILKLAIVLVILVSVSIITLNARGSSELINTKEWKLIDNTDYCSKDCYAHFVVMPGSDFSASFELYYDISQGSSLSEMKIRIGQNVTVKKTYANASCENKVVNYLENSSSGYETVCVGNPYTEFVDEIVYSPITGDVSFIKDQPVYFEVYGVKQDHSNIEWQFNISTAGQKVPLSVLKGWASWNDTYFDDFNHNWTDDWNRFLDDGEIVEWDSVNHKYVITTGSNRLFFLCHNVTWDADQSEWFFATNAKVNNEFYTVALITNDTPPLTGDLLPNNYIKWIGHQNPTGSTLWYVYENGTQQFNSGALDTSNPRTYSFQRMPNGTVVIKSEGNVSGSYENNYQWGPAKNISYICIGVWAGSSTPYSWDFYWANYTNQSLTSYINETKGRAAIEAGIYNSSAVAGIIKTDMEIYGRNADNNQVVGSFDKLLFYNNQRWAFNYLAESDNAVNMFNLTPALYVLEISDDKTEEEIRSEVETFINNTIS